MKSIECVYMGNPMLLTEKPHKCNAIHVKEEFAWYHLQSVAPIFPKSVCALFSSSFFLVDFSFSFLLGVFASVVSVSSLLQFGAIEIFGVENVKPLRPHGFLNRFGSEQKLSTIRKPIKLKLTGCTYKSNGTYVLDE